MFSMLLYSILQQIRQVLFDMPYSTETDEDKASLFISLDFS